MRILVTGANGFLGIHLCRILLKKNLEFVATGRKENFAGEFHPNLHYVQLDFTDPFAVHDVFEKYRPAVVIHAGAMTKVDECEKDQWNAYVNNVEATLTLLANAEEQKSFFIFISTDFVFDGKKGNYVEEDETAPVNFYGKTKEEAEEAVKEYEFDWAIVRTSLVYGKSLGGKDNILTIVKEKLSSSQSYGVVNDQVRSPTYVEDLAAGIISIVEKKAKGIFHLSGKDILRPYQMAILTAEYLEADKSFIKELNAGNFSQPARRPLNTNLVIDKAKRILNYKPLSFEEGLKKTFS